MGVSTPNFGWDLQYYTRYRAITHYTSRTISSHDTKCPRTTHTHTSSPWTKAQGNARQKKNIRPSVERLRQQWPQKEKRKRLVMTRKQHNQIKKIEQELAGVREIGGSV